MIILADPHVGADVNHVLIRQSTDSIKLMADVIQLLRSLLNILTIGVASEALLLEYVEEVQHGFLNILIHLKDSAKGKV